MKLLSLEKCVTLDYDDNDIISYTKEGIMKLLRHGLLRKLNNQGRWYNFTKPTKKYCGVKLE